MIYRLDFKKPHEMTLRELYYRLNHTLRREYSTGTKVYLKEFFARGELLPVSNLIKNYEAYHGFKDPGFRTNCIFLLAQEFVSAIYWSETGSSHYFDLISALTGAHILNEAEIEWAIPEDAVTDYHYRLICAYLSSLTPSALLFTTPVLSDIIFDFLIKHHLKTIPFENRNMSIYLANTKHTKAEMTNLVKRTVQHILEVPSNYATIVNLDEKVASRFGLIIS